MKKITLLLSLLIPVFTFSQIINIPADYPSIQQGIDAANNGDTVLVDTGTYFENINFNGKAITVASHYIVDGDTNHINNTTIDGSQPDNPHLGSVVTFMSGEDTTSVINGFTITGGSGLGIANKRVGGGIICFQSGAKILNNKILNNEITHSDRAIGGGICSYYDVGEEWVIMENNNISGNSCNATNISANGGGIYTGTNARIINNNISNNECICELANADGGGVEIENLHGIVDTVFLLNNTIHYNSVSAFSLSAGGGVASIYSYNIIQNNTIKYNTVTGEETHGGGLWFLQSAGTLMSNNVISYNTVNKVNKYWGAGVLFMEPLGAIYITDNEFSYNTGELTPVGAGGALSFNGAFNILVYVQDNLIIHNEAYHGGGFYEKNCYNVILIDNLFVENKSYRGGAIGTFHPAITSHKLEGREKDFSPRIINNTFSLNTASSDAGAIRLQCDINAPVIYNCIFHGNESPLGDDIYNWRDDTAMVSFSNIDTMGIVGNWTGRSNINTNPMFVNSGEHPYQINDYSPCIDAGTPDTTGLNLPEYDLAGEKRIFNDRVDMGAYEWSTFVGVAESAINHKLKVRVYPNPFSTSTTIEYDLPQPSTVQLTIFNHLGTQVDFIQQNQSRGKQQITWDALSLPPGIYYFRLQTGEQLASGKLVIVH